MINKEIAYSKINDILLGMEKSLGIKLKINDDYFQEYYDYMLFAYNSHEYLQNGNNSYLLVGNLPLIIEKNKGSVYKLLNSECDLNNFKFDELLSKCFLEKVFS